jgi:predicted ATPase
MAARSYTDPATERAYERAVELSRGIGNAPRLSQALLGLATFYLVRGRLDTATDVGQALLDLGQRASEPGPTMAGHLMLGLPLLFRGEPRRALEHAESAIAIYDPALHRQLADAYGQDAGVVSRLLAGWSQWLLGYPDRAVQSVRDAVELAQEVRHPFSLVFALAFCGVVHQMRREPAAVRELARELIAVSTEQRFPVWLGWGLVLEGWALADSVDGNKAIETLREGLERIARTGANASGPVVVSMLADVCRAQGRGDDALRWVQAGFTIGKATGQHFWDAELHRLRGSVLLQRDPRAHAEAESCFREALAIAREQSARSLELRAATSVAHLWQQQGREDEARSTLRKLCEQFTEGFDTADLSEARRLADALA